MSIFRKIVNSQIWLSRKFDEMLPEVYSIDGNKDFLNKIAPQYIQNAGFKVYDLGGGSQPYVTKAQKDMYGLTLVGLDIEAEELDAAPNGVYDEKIVSDLSEYRGDGDADLIVCQATLEHVHDNVGAFKALATTLKSGGRAILFAPSRKAAFAQLNLILPERIKKKLLFKFFPHKAAGHDGFQAFYDHCTPRQFRLLAQDNGLKVEMLKPYYMSSYFQVCFPLYFVWRIWMVCFKTICAEDAAETFTMVIKKP